MVFCLVPSFVWGQSTYAPTLHRACLNRVNSELSLLLSKGDFPCADFTTYRLWGRTDEISEFELLGESTNPNINTWNVLLPNRKKWELYVSAHFNCSGQDSFASFKIFVDDVPPSYVEPDSVSIDLASQKLIAGWTNPPETDILGYSMFKVDGSGNNTLIDEKNVLFYSFATSVFNGNNAGNRLAIAAYDSCKNGGVISAFHSPMLLSVATSVNYLCDKGLLISWTPYVGWVSEKHEVFIWDKDRGVVIHQESVPGNTSSLTYTLPYLGMNIDVYVRAHKQGSVITSTSNKRSLFVADFPKPVRATSLYFASVVSDNSISLEGYVEPGDSFVIFYKNTVNGAWSPIKNVSQSTGIFNHVHTLNDTRVSAVDFQVVRFNSCGFPSDSSLIIKTIHLKNTDRDLVWNHNTQWSILGATTEYILEKKELNSWEEIGRTGATTYTLDPYGAYWVRVKGICNLWGAEGKGYSYSNPIYVDLGFDSSLKDTLLIPNVFSPEGNNPVFRISNPAISLGESTLRIFNRWGEKIWEGDALLGWDGTVNGDAVIGGHYVYQVLALYRRKRIEKAGMILLLR